MTSDIDLIENVGTHIKEHTGTGPTPSIPCLQEAIVLVWKDMDQEYFENLDTNMTQRLYNVLRLDVN